MPDTTTQTVQLFSQKYRIKNCCLDAKEVYFLSRTGAIETLYFEEAYSTEVEVSQQEASIEPYSRSFYPTNDKLLADQLKREQTGNKLQYNSTAQRQLKLKLRIPPSKEISDYLESFLTSSMRYLKVKYDNTFGNLYVEPITIAHSTSEIDRGTGLLNFEVTIVYDSTDLKW